MPIIKKRLAKRWLASHLPSCALAEEAVELLVAYIFVRPGPYTPPFSRISRFLQLLCNFDWSLAPLIIDVNGDLTAKDEEQIQAQFEALQSGLSTIQRHVVKDNSGKCHPCTLLQHMTWDQKLGRDPPQQTRT